MVFAILSLIAAANILNNTGAAAEPNKNLPQRVILIRHGEKPDKGDDLSPRGYQRARCLADHFSSHAYNVTHLFAYTDHPTKRPVETLTPIANKLGLQIDTRAGRDDIDDLIDHIKKLDTNATAVVCWEHKVIRDIAKALGVDHAPDYYSDDFDHEWRIREGELDEAHEHC